MCFTKVCLSHRSQAGTERGLGALQHSLWPDVRSNRLAIWTKALWVLWIFIQINIFFKLPAPGIDPLTLGLQGQSSAPTPRGLTTYVWLICNDISYIGNCSEVDRKRKNRIIIPDWPQHHYSTLAVAVMWLAGVVAAAAVGTVNQNWKFHWEIIKYLSRCYTGFPFWEKSTNVSFTADSIL